MGCCSFDIPEFQYCDILDARINMEKSRDPHSVSLKGGEDFPECLSSNADKKASLAVSPRKPHSIMNTNPFSLRPTLAQKFPLPRQETESLQIGDGGASELFSGASEEKFIISPLVRHGIVLCDLLFSGSLRSAAYFATSLWLSLCGRNVFLHSEC